MVCRFELLKENFFTVHFKRVNYKEVTGTPEKFDFSKFDFSGPTLRPGGGEGLFTQGEGSEVGESVTVTCE